MHEYVMNSSRIVPVHVYQGFGLNRLRLATLNYCSSGRPYIESLHVFNVLYR